MNSLTPMANTPISCSPYGTEQIPFDSMRSPSSRSQHQTIEQKEDINVQPQVIKTVLLVRPLRDNESENLIWNREPNLPRLNGSKYQRVGVMGDSNCLFHCVLKTFSPLYQDSYETRDVITETRLRFYEAQVQNTLKFTALFDKPRSNDEKTVYRITDQARFHKQMESWRTLFADQFRYELANKLKTDITTQNNYIKVSPEQLNRYKEAYPDKSATQIWDKIFEDQSKELTTRMFMSIDYFYMLGEQIGFDVYIIRDRDIIDPNSKNNIVFGLDYAQNLVRGPRTLRKIDNPKLSESERPTMIVMVYGDNHFELISKVWNQGDTLRAQFKHSPDDPLVQLLYQTVINKN
jgi:hypothetical protein